MSDLTVTTHVGRDLLSSAAAFKNEASAVWEYVANSLQYVDPEIEPVVQIDVEPKRKRISIADKGRGMDKSALAHFFTMHGENLERAAGRVAQ